MGLLGARVQPYAGQAQYAYFETYDDNPQWTHGDFFKSTDGLDQSGTADFTDEAKYEAKTHTVNMYTLERSSLYAIECLCLKNAAQVLGYEEDVKEHQQAYEQICDNINRYMWDEETGCYYNLRFDGTQSRVQTPDCFLPMAAGAADEKKVKRLLQLLTDEGKFWGDYPMPSVAKDHPAYPAQTY
jgi:neutral trehalase